MCDMCARRLISRLREKEKNISSKCEVAWTTSQTPHLFDN